MKNVKIALAIYLFSVTLEMNFDEKAKYKKFTADKNKNKQRLYEIAAMSPPIVTHAGSAAAVSFVENCPILAKSYDPPRFWGKNGHCQSLIFSLKGRFGDLKPTNGTRFHWTTEDGATASFDVFEPTKEHREICDGVEGREENREDKGKGRGEKMDKWKEKEREN